MASDDRSAYVHPEVYDAINTPGTAAEVSGLQDIASRFVLPEIRSRKAARRAALGLTWLEPACGSGRYLRVLAARMAKAADRGTAGRSIGLDREQAMLDFARCRIAKLTGRAADLVHLVRCDIRAFGPSRVPTASIDFAFCPHNSLRHLGTADDLLRHLRCIRRTLNPRGVYAVGIELNGPATRTDTGEQPAQFPSEAVYTARRSGKRFRQVFEYLPPPGPDDPFETVITWAEVERGPMTRPMREEFASTYRLRAWTLREWHAMLDRAGLREIGVVDSHGRPLAEDRLLYAFRVVAHSPR